MLIFISVQGMSQQFPSQIWHDGKLVLANEDTIQGQIMYNLDRDIVQVKTSKKIFTFSSSKIFFFEIFDKTVDNYRQFYALPYAIQGTYKTPVLFEVLVEGKITLLARENISYRSAQIDPYSYRMGSYSKKVLVYDYYFLDSKGKITKYTMKKKDLLDVLSRRYDQMQEYIRVNNLRHDKRNDLIRIISYYNAVI